MTELNLTPDNIDETIASLTPEQRQQVRDQALILVARGFGVEAVHCYALYVHGWVLEPHHLEWLKHMFSGEKVLIVAPPETGKTRLIKIFIEWYIGKYPENATMYVQNSGPQAKAQVVAIGKTLKENPKYREVFPHILPTEQWGGSAIFVKRDPASPLFSRSEGNLEGYGLFGGYQGKHVEGQVLDDPTNQEDVLSPTTMLAQKEHVKGVFKDRLKDDLPVGIFGFFFGILTRWASDDLVPVLEQLGVKILIYPARKGKKGDPVQLTYPWGHLLQESMYPDDKLDRLREEKGPDMFDLTYMCKTEGATRGTKVFAKLNLTLHFRAIPPKWRFIDKILGMDYGTCFPLNTEILTKRGFKRHDELELGELVAAYDWQGSTRQLVWTPLRVVTHLKSQPLVEMRNKSFRFICTPDHGWVVKRGKRGRMTKDTYAKQPLYEIAGLVEPRIVVSSEAAGGTLNCSPGEAAVLGWLVTDGWIQNLNTPKMNGVIAQKNHCADVERDLHDSGLPFTEMGTRNGIRQWRLRTPALREFLERIKYTGKDALTGIVCNLTVKARTRMLDAMLMAEGTSNGTPRQAVFCQSDGGVLEAFQVLATLCGVRLGVLREQAGSSFKSSPGRVAYRSSLLRSQVVCTSKLLYTEQEPEDVWCVTVDEGSVVARQNGQITITGNTIQHQSALVLTGTTAHNLVVVRAGWMSPSGSSDELVDVMSEWKSNPKLGWNRVYIDPSQGSLVDRFRGEFGIPAFLGHRYVPTRIGALLTLIDRGAIAFDMNGPGVEKVWTQVTSYRYDDAGKVIELADDLVDGLLYNVYAAQEGAPVGYGKPAEIVDSGKVKSYGAGWDVDKFDPTTETGIGQQGDGFKGWGSTPSV